jgi:hypothetical protein
VLFAVFGIAAAASAIAWAKTRGHPTELISSTIETKSEGETPRAAARGSDEPGPSGVNIDELPAEQRQAQPTNASPQRGTNRGSKKDESAKDSKKPEPELPENPYPKDVKGTEPPPAEALPEPAEVAPPPAPPPPPAVDGEAGPFSRGAAMAALGSASSRAASCKRPDGPTGMGRATVTFAPSGAVSNVVVPAPFSGTGVGACVTAVFKGARVPAFTGSSVQLPQSFRIPE